MVCDCFVPFATTSFILTLFKNFIRHYKIDFGTNKIKISVQNLKRRMEDLPNKSETVPSITVGEMVSLKLNDCDPTNRKMIEAKIFNALYTETQPMNSHLDRLTEFLRDIYDGIDEETTQELTAKIRNLCMESLSKCAIRKDTNGLNFMTEPKWVAAKRKVGTRVKILIGLNRGTFGKVVEIKPHAVAVQVPGGKIVKYLPKYLQFVKPVVDEDESDSDGTEEGEINDE